MSEESEIEGHNEWGRKQKCTTEKSVCSNGLLSGNESSVYLYAARYAHNRNTGAAKQVVDTILHNWDRFDRRTRKQLQKEALEAAYNIGDWQRLIAR